MKRSNKRSSSIMFAQYISQFNCMICGCYGVLVTKRFNFKLGTVIIRLTCICGLDQSIVRKMDILTIDQFKTSQCVISTGKKYINCDCEQVTNMTLFACQIIKKEWRKWVKIRQ